MANLIIISILLIIASLITICYFWLFILPLFRGAPYAPSNQQIIEKMIKMAEIKPGEKVVDLGSGDGRIVFELTKTGATAYGYEISPLLVWISRLNAKRKGLADKTQFYKKDFWKEDLSDFDVIIIYQVSYIMKKLEKKLKQELKPGARVVNNAFGFPNWEPVSKEKGVYLYHR